MTQTTVALAGAPLGADVGESQNIDDFIYLLSHDVRASVRALIELPQWIEEDLKEAGIELGGSVLQSIEMMNRHTARLDRMLSDLLAYSRIGRTQQDTPVDIAKALDGVVQGLDIPDTVTLDRKIECPTIAMGQDDLSLLLGALVGNAIKHNDAKAGYITVCTQKDGSVIRFTIHDNGPGIPAHLYGKAVCAMTTLRSRDEVEGTGMGLAHVQKIAEHYGGRLILSQAQEGVSGLRVDVVLPCASG